MAILKNFQAVGPFKAGVVGQRANIAGGSVPTGLEIDNKFNGVNTAHTICHIGIQTPISMPNRYIEELSVKKDKDHKNLPQDRLKYYLNEQMMDLDVKKNETVYLEKADEDAEVNYYMPRLYVDKGGNVKEYGDDICIKGICKSLSSDSKVSQDFIEYFSIPENGILEYDALDCYGLEIYFLKDMPPQTSVDIVWKYKG